MSTAVLADFCDISAGGRKKWTGKDFVDHGFPAYGAGGLNGQLPNYEFDQSAIVLSSIGARCGKCFFAEGKWASLANTQLIFPDLNKADPRFLWYQLNDENRWPRSGTAQPFIKPSHIKAHHVYLPSLEEQRRIAAVLDAADELRAKRRQALAKLDTLTQAIFIDMFGDPFRPNAETVPLAEVAEIMMGQSPPGDSYNEHGDGTALLNGPTEFGDQSPTPVQWTTAPTRMSRQGDILFCVRGATAGRLNWADSAYCLGRGLAAIRAESSHRAFLYRVLDAYYPRFQSSGVGSTFINISKKDLHGVPIPVADDYQVDRFGQVQSKLDEAMEISRATLDSNDTLFASLQQRAFRGEL